MVLTPSISEDSGHHCKVLENGMPLESQSALSLVSCWCVRFGEPGQLSDPVVDLYHGNSPKHMAFHPKYG